MKGRPTTGQDRGQHAEATDPLHYLARGSALLHLSVETPERVPGWDAIILTAANQHQARLYELQLQAARRRGLIAQSTRTLVAADPDGMRIGSGGATLNALRRLGEVMPDARDAKVLLIHAGGDSRRVPWANLFGKCFIPFPLFADPDRAVPTIFDHQLAIAAPFARQMKGGGLLTLSGDVVPLLAVSRVQVPENGGLVVTVPASLDVAERHGVIVADKNDNVTNLIQKAPAETLVSEGALVAGGAALLDTGIYMFTGGTFRGLQILAQAEDDPVEELMKSGEQCSVYEEIAAALVPSQHDWLANRPVGKRILHALSGGSLVHHRADELTFVHFGSSSEVLQHFGNSWEGRFSRRILAEGGSAVSPSAVICTSSLGPTVSVGEGTVVYGCNLGRDINIGNRCVIVGVNSDGVSFRMRDNTCLWQVPVIADDDNHHAGIVTACCGVDDNPKLSSDAATFCNRSMDVWLAEHQVSESDLWQGDEDHTLWNARLFPNNPDVDGLLVASWLLGHGDSESPVRKVWQESDRLSFAALSRQLDVECFMERQSSIRTELIVRSMKQTAGAGLEQNLAALAEQLESIDESLADLASSIELPDTHTPTELPASRLIQMKSDLMGAAGRSNDEERLALEAFTAVHSEVARFVKPYTPAAVQGVQTGTSEEVRLPVRFDMAGGWSDTPPYCIERPACVLNMAIELNGELPVGASVEAIDNNEWELILGDADLTTVVRAGETVSQGVDLRDPFALLRTALVLTGYGSDTEIHQGVRVHTWANAPRGSGLGTSSVLAAALLTALQRLAGRPDDIATVSDLTLLLEQRLTTGGGWQDQIGGLVPGVKCIFSAPVRPIRLNIEPVPLLPGIVEELEQRFVLAFTGQERLAKNVLQIVVGRYLQRDSRALAAVARLVDLADDGRKALALGDLDAVGHTMAEAWDVHQELDPHCSNAEVDAMFDQIEDLASGGKLAGAGGGGFLGVMAKDADAAERIRTILNDIGGGISIYDWKLWQG